MAFVEPSRVQSLLAAAAGGDAGAVRELDKLTVPFAASPDFAALVLVQPKRAVVDPTGRIKVTNAPPEAGGRVMQGLDVYIRGDVGIAGSFVPIPTSFRVSSVEYRDGSFCFLADDGRKVSASVDQMRRGMQRVQFSMDGVTESELEVAFLSLPTVIPQSPVRRRTAADNPPLDSPVGVWAFDERLQWFVTTYVWAGLAIRLSITTPDRQEAAELVAWASGILRDWSNFDAASRDFATTELLAIKNEKWLDKSESPIDAQRFTTRLKVESISFSRDRQATVYYQDGEMFLGHTVVVKLDPSGRPREATLAG